MDILEAIPLAAVPVVELQLCGHTIINIIVPAAVAATVNSELTPREIARKAVDGAYISSAIPGGVHNHQDKISGPLRHDPLPQISACFIFANRVYRQWSPVPGIDYKW